MGSELAIRKLFPVHFGNGNRSFERGRDTSCLSSGSDSSNQSESCHRWRRRWAGHKHYVTLVDPAMRGEVPAWHSLTDYRVKSRQVQYLLALCYQLKRFVALAVS